MIRSIHCGRTLQLVFDMGMVSDRKKIATKTFSNLKYDATDENLYEFGRIIAGLQERQLEDIYLNEKFNLVEQ